MDFPRPPADLSLPDPWGRFEPAIELEKWVRKNIIFPNGDLANPDHAHLNSAILGIVWTSVPGKLKSQPILGTCQLGEPSGQPWSKGRQRQQIEDWFGELPDFLIVLDAPYAATADNASILAVIEHELYHAGLAEDEYGHGRFDGAGREVWAIKPHDSEEFIGVVRRYGTGAEHHDNLRRLVEAASKEPEIGRAKLDGICGTCLRAVA